MKYIAICLNIPVFWNNKILDEEHCAKYFGASWFPIFSKMAQQNGYEVMSGDVVLNKIVNEKLKSKNVYVIQELNAKHGKKLLKLGAIGLILTGAESPLFSYYFYDNLKIIAKYFKYRLLFNGSFNLINELLDHNRNFQFNFPSYSLNDYIHHDDWNKKDFMVMIAANKSGYSPIPNSLKDKAIWFIHRAYKLFSPSFKIAQLNELHSKRIEVVKYFGNKSELKLFGSNWKDYSRFKNSEREKLITVIKKLNPTFVDDKIETLSKYKFAVCFENISFNGYITEKIIHCFIAGVIPIYCGADDIAEFIPKESFIDFRDFNSLPELEEYLYWINKTNGEKIINRGKEFLKSENGKKYSYEYFANNILDLVTSFDNNK